MSDHNGWANEATETVNLWLFDNARLVPPLLPLTAESAEAFMRTALPDGSDLDAVDWESIADAWNQD